MLKIYLIWFITIIQLFSEPSTAEQKKLTGLDVMTMVQNETQKKQTRKAVVDMKIYDDENRERVRFFNYWTKYKKNEEHSLIKFFRPKNVKGTALLTNTDKTSDTKINGSTYQHLSLLNGSINPIKTKVLWAATSPILTLLDEN